MACCEVSKRVTVGRHERPEPFEYIFVSAAGVPLDLHDYTPSAVVWSDPDTVLGTYVAPVCDWIDGDKGHVALRWPDDLLDGPPGETYLTFWAEKAGFQRLSSLVIAVTTEERGPAPA